MINIKKLKKINSIRKEIGALASDNEFFSRSEVESLLDKINPSFDRMSVSLEDMLKVGVRGWSPQTTIPSHPNLKNVNLILTLLQHRSTNRPLEHKVISGDRLQIREAMGAAGMEDPLTDTDCRQTEIWNIIEASPFAVELHLGYDFLNNLGSRDSVHYKMAQSRVQSENQESITGLFERFYTAGESQKRPSIGVVLGGKLFLGSGWHRAHAHRLAQKNEYNSMGPVLIVGNGATQKQKIKFLLTCASISNKDTGDQTEMESMADVAHQVKQNFNFLCEYDEGFSGFSEQERITWATAWLKENKMKYRPESMIGIRTQIANIAFSSNSSQSLPMPEESIHSNIWNGFFPNDIWAPQDETAVIQQVVTSNVSNLELGHFRNWKKTTTRVPKRTWLLARMGSVMTTSITNIQSVKDHRSKVLDNLTINNNNQKLRAASFPVYDKVVFVKQCDGLPAAAYAWSVQSKTFNKI